MTLEETLNSYLDSIDTKKFLTYEAYILDCIEDGDIPIKKDQWDILISKLGGRKMQDTASAYHRLQNLKTAAANIK